MADQSTETPFNATLGSNTWRASLRREKLAARAALDLATHARTSERIRDHLFTLLRERSPGTLAYCWPIRNEVDCRPLAGRLLETGWKLAMPVVTAIDAPMAFHDWVPGMAMKSDPHGIQVPAVSLPCTPDVLLVPLVAFDGAGYRIGYGGGYFDRTLAICTPRPYTIGVGFELGRVASILPEAHDIPLDCIVTEVGINFTSTP